MKSVLLPFLALLALLSLPFAYRKDPASQPTRYFWLTLYSYDVPGGELSAGQHTYEFSFHYSTPRSGELIGKPHNFQLDNVAPVYRGYALLRPGGLQALVDTQDGFSCEKVKALNTAQPLRFFVAWSYDASISSDQMKRQLASMKAEIRIDGREWMPLVKQHTTVSWEPLWNCQPWIVNQTGAALSYLIPG